MIVFPESIDAQGVVALKYHVPNVPPDLKGKMNESPELGIGLLSFIEPFPSLRCALERFLCPVASDVQRVKRKS